MILRCKASYVSWKTGVPVVVNAGDLLDSGDHRVKGWESQFEPLEQHLKAAPVVEAATAAPGEKRSVTSARRPPKSSSKTSG